MRCCSLLFIVALLKAQDASGTLSGEVRASDSIVVPGAYARLSVGEPPQTIYSARSDSAGKLQFGGLAAGTYTLTLNSPGFITLTLKSIQVAAREQKVLPLLRLDVGGCGVGKAYVEYFQILPTEQNVGSILGHVVRQQRKYRKPEPPIGGATVELLCEGRKICGEANTDSNGKFVFTNLPPRDYVTIRVTHAGFYQFEEWGYHVSAGLESTYWPITLEHCPGGNCDPRLRPKKPLPICE